VNDDPQKANVVPIGSSATLSPVQKASNARAQLARLPAPAHRLREKATTLLQQTLKNLFDGADDALFDLADRATSNQDQNTYFEAMREVRLKRRETEIAFFTKLDQAFADLLKVIPDQDDDFVADISLDELSLVDNEQLEFQVAVESMIAKVLERSAEAAQHIALRLDSLVPAKVYQQNNPVGPHRLCNSFWQVVEPLDVDIKAKLVLLKLFDKAVMAQLHKVYTVLNNLLIQQNVLPSLSSRPERRRASRSVQSSSAGAAGAGDVSEQDQQVLEQLRGLMSSQGAAPGSASGGVLPAGELAQVLTALQQKVPVGAQQQASLLDNQQLLSMIAPATQSGQTMSAMDQDVMNLINMLFQFILDDRNLAAAMQSLLARLQIPLLKVAVVDKSFFNKAGHPARRLLNELATAALGWQEPEKGAVRDPLFRKVSAVVEEVITQFESDVTIFETLLTDFIAFTEKEKRRATVLEKRTLDAEDGKAKSEQARATVSAQLDLIVQGRTLPDCVQAIVEGPWHNVLFLSLLKHGDDSDDWRESCEVVEQLVWSVTTPLDTASRSELMGLLRTLLPNLRKGFETISYNPFEMNKLLKQLEQEHLRRLRAPVAVEAEELPEIDANSASDTASVDAVASTETVNSAGEVNSAEAKASDVNPALAVPQASVAATTATQAKVAQENTAQVKTPQEPESLAAASEATQKDDLIHAEPQGSMDEELSVASAEKKSTVASSADPVLQESIPVDTDSSQKAGVDDNASSEAEVSNSWLEQVDRFAQGSWFEVSEDSKPTYRCRLAAVIKGVDKFIFVNRNGMKVAEKSRQELAVALQQGRFSILDDGMLFDRALESVIGNLRHSRGAVS